MYKCCGLMLMSSAAKMLHLEKLKLECVKDPNRTARQFRLPGYERNQTQNS